MVVAMDILTPTLITVLGWRSETVTVKETLELTTEIHETLEKAENINSSNISTNLTHLPLYKRVYRLENQNGMLIRKVSFCSSSSICARVSS